MGEYYKSNPLYWLFLLPWHLGFIFIITFHILCFFAALAMVGGLEIGAASGHLAGKAFYYLLLVTGGIAFVTGTFGSIGMGIIRLADRSLRIYAMPMNFFNYLFFLIVYGSGLLAWLVLDPTLVEYRTYWMGLITLSPPALHPMTVLHIVLFDIFLIYLPFTRSTHYITRILAYFFIRWDDEPNQRGSKMERKINDLLGQKVSWEGPHITKGKSWVEVATEPGFPDTKKDSK
jgi:nitrate reductase gamma subunit